MPKMELLEGSGASHVQMVRRIEENAKQDGSEVIGIVVFARNDATHKLHTYIGSRTWPTDLDLWPRLVDALAQTIADARAQVGTSTSDPVPGPESSGVN